MKSLIEKAYSPSNFRKKGHKLVDQLADYLEATTKREERPVLKLFEPEELYQQWDKALHEKNPDFNEWAERVIEDSIHLHNPNYMGHQVSTALPEAVLAEFMGSVLNNGMGTYEMGSPAIAMERVIIKKLAQKLGFDDDADGILTSGGTLGNLTALLGMRQVMGNKDIWNESNDSERFAVMVSEEAHYSISRAVKIMGWGEQGLIKVPTDEQFRLDADQLAGCYSEAINNGLNVLGVVGNACSTATGSFDPLNKIADFCQPHDLWLHVDAAHGGGAAFSQKYRPLLDGIHHADSVIVDFHKMLMCPSLVTGVVFKDGSNSYKAFAQKASYLWEKESPEWFNLGKRTFECTKDMMGLKVYAILKEYGTKLFNEIVEHQFNLGRTLAAMIQQHSKLELLSEPDCNIVCFRFGTKKSISNELNKYIRRQLLKNGHHFIVQTEVKGRIYLRAVLMNPLTTQSNLKSLIEEIEQIAYQYQSL